MPNIKRKSNSHFFGTKINNNKNETMASKPITATLVYFDPEDLRQLQEIDAELTIEFRKRQGTFKQGFQSFYHFLTR